MTAALLLVRTPFQGFLASKVLRAEAVETYDLLYFTQHDVAEDKHYYKQLAGPARNATYCYAPRRRFDVLAYIDFPWQARRWVKNIRHDLLLMASIDSYVLAAIAAIAARQDGAELVTFDDGTRNYNRNSLYHIDRPNRRGRLYRTLIGASSPDDLKRRIAHHYTLHPRFENIVPRHKLRWIDTAEAENKVRRPDGPPMTFFIGRPLAESEYMTPEQIERFAACARGWPIDFYVKHPRETAPLDLGAPAYKIASFEAVDLLLIRYSAGTGKPMIISTGMADAGEIAEAVESAREGGCREFAILHYVSGYPAPPGDCNLRTIPDMIQRFGLVTGLSDHTLDNTTAIASVALGASIIEKHFTLDRNDGGPDDSFSLEPAQMAALCASASTAWEALGRIEYGRKSSEQGNVQFRRSLYVVEDIPKGGEITRQNVRSIGPGHGLAPKHLPAVLGRCASAASSSAVNR